jgi:hypothetical protein
VDDGGVNGGGNEDNGYASGEDAIRESFAHAEDVTDEPPRPLPDVPPESPLQGSHGSDGEWAEPKSLDNGQLPVKVFNTRLLPAAMRPWVEDIAERAQCPPDFLATGVIVQCAALVARHLIIRPKRHDDWAVVPNLWGAVIAPPGFLKSPALAEVLKPTRRLEYDAKKDLASKVLDFEAGQTVLKVRRESVEREMRVALKHKDEVKLSELRSLLAGLTEEGPKAPRFIVNDTTVEKLGELLNENPGGLLVFRDELNGFLRSLERQGHEGDRAFYCEAWNGDAGYTYDRIGRGTVAIERACVSLLGGIQPGPWRAYLREAFRDAAGDGFINRFQVLVWPDISGEWKNCDRRPNTSAADTAHKVIAALADLKPLDLGAQMQADGGGMPFMRFAEDAQDLFDEWRGDLEAKIRNPNEEVILISHLAKHRKLMPALALIFHAMNCVEKGLEEGSGSFVTGVSLSSAEQAAAWCDFLELHARRCFQSVTDASGAGADALAQKIRNGKLPSPFKPRDVYRAHWSDLNRPDDVYRAAEVLEAAAWLRSEEIATDPENGGRPSVRFWINPKLSKSTEAPE